MARRYNVRLDSKPIPGVGSFNDIVVTVEAPDKWAAEDAAFLKIKKGIVPESKRTDWTVTSVERDTSGKPIF